MRWIDNVADLKVIKINQWMEKKKTESSGEWLLRRPRLTQGCSAERMDGIVNKLECLYISS